MRDYFRRAIDTVEAGRAAKLSREEIAAKTPEGFEPFVSFNERMSLRATLEKTWDELKQYTQTADASTKELGGKMDEIGTTLKGMKETIFPRLEQEAQQSMSNAEMDFQDFKMDMDLENVTRQNLAHSCWAVLPSRYARQLGSSAMVSVHSALLDHRYADALLTCLSTGP